MSSGLLSMVVKVKSCAVVILDLLKSPHAEEPCEYAHSHALRRLEGWATVSLLPTLRDAHFVRSSG
jgi:hypothetical protein